MITRAVKQCYYFFIHSKISIYIISYYISIAITSKKNIYFENKNRIDCLDNLAMSGPTWVIFFSSGKLADNALAPKRHVQCTIELARCLFITTTTTITTDGGHDL